MPKTYIDQNRNLACPSFQPAINASQFVGGYGSYGQGPCAQGELQYSINFRFPLDNAIRFCAPAVSNIQKDFPYEAAFNAWKEIAPVAPTLTANSHTCHYQSPSNPNTFGTIGSSEAVYFNS